MKRIIAIFAAVAIAFLAFASPARAASAEATKAADWIVAHHLAASWNPSSAADDILALASTGDTSYNDAIYTRLTYLKKQAAAYIADANDGTVAAKLAIVAAATGQDANDFGGNDLIALVNAAIKADGSIGDYPGPFSSGLAMIALARNGEPIPAAMTTYLLTYRTTDGGFGWSPGTAVYDPDASALAVLGLQAAATSPAVVTDALATLAGAQDPDGAWRITTPWPNVPVNSVGMVGPLMSGAAKTRATSYVESQQRSDGGLKTGVSGAADADLSATQQGILALTDQTYLSISFKVTTPTATPSSPSTSPSRSATSTTTASTTAKATAKATATADPSGVLANTGSGVGFGLMVAALLVAGAGTVLLVPRRPRA